MISSVISSIKRFLNRHRNFSSTKYSWSLRLMILGGNGSKLVRRIVTTYENQRDRFPTHVLWKRPRQLIKNESMQLGFSRFLKHVGSFTMFFSLKGVQREDIEGSEKAALRSPVIKKMLISFTRSLELFLKLLWMVFYLRFIGLYV